jgi:hypothetical protein
MPPSPRAFSPEHALHARSICCAEHGCLSCTPQGQHAPHLVLGVTCTPPSPPPPPPSWHVCWTQGCTAGQRAPSCSRGWRGSSTARSIHRKHRSYCRCPARCSTVRAGLSLALCSCHHRPVLLQPSPPVLRDSGWPLFLPAHKKRQHRRRTNRCPCQWQSLVQRQQAGSRAAPWCERGGRVWGLWHHQPARVHVLRGVWRPSTQTVAPRPPIPHPIATMHVCHGAYGSDGCFS